MNIRSPIGRLTAVVACLALAQAALAEATSSSVTSVVLQPKETILWATAGSNVLQLPIELPRGATSATLEVTGSFGYTATHTDIVKSPFELTLPAATGVGSEQVYELRLSFVGSSVVRTARIGCIAGFDGSATGRASCRVNCSARKWGTAESRNAVLPIPAGTDSLTVDGVPRETGLDGAAGWYGLVVDGTSAAPQVVRISGEGWSASADLHGKEGISVILR